MDGCRSMAIRSRARGWGGKKGIPTDQNSCGESRVLGGGHRNGSCREEIGRRIQNFKADTRTTKTRKGGKKRDRLQLQNITRDQIAKSCKGDPWQKFAEGAGTVAGAEVRGGTIGRGEREKISIRTSKGGAQSLGGMWD